MSVDGTSKQELEAEISALKDKVNEHQEAITSILEILATLHPELLHTDLDRNS